MSFSNPVAKSVGADGTAPGRVWESRLLPALIIPDGGWGVVPVWRMHPTHPLFFVLFCLLVCFMGCGVVRGLWGVVDVGDELLCFVDQGVAEESGTRQQHQHNTSMMKCGVMFVALDVHVAEV